MFDIGWTEMLVIAIVMVVVVGPKDLPRMLRTFGKTAAKLRSMAGDFQKQFNDALKEAELDDVKKSVDELRSLNPANEIRKQLNPFEKVAADVRAGLDSALKPSQPAKPAAPDAQAVEPLKSGATAMPAAPLMQATNGAAASPVQPMAAPAAAAAAVKKAKPAPARATKPKAVPEKQAPARAAASNAPAAAPRKTAAAKSAAKPAAKKTKAST